jgi:phosphopantothenoylcysteine decarboxylase/phosphopantothenate--cysteine ligase
MGIEIANSAAKHGAEVILITGPTHYKADSSRVSTFPVFSAKEMYDTVHQYFKSVDAAILSAAVADYRPKKHIAFQNKKDVPIVINNIRKDGGYFSVLRGSKNNTIFGWFCFGD